MPRYEVTLYDFLATPPSAGAPETVEAPDAMAAARQFIDEPLERTGYFPNLAAEVKRFDGATLAQRVLLYRRPG